jgi:hypothetical protein
MLIQLLHHLDYEGTNVQYFSSLEEARAYLLDKSPIFIDLDHVELHYVGEEIDVKALVPEKFKSTKEGKKK